MKEKSSFILLFLTCFFAKGQLITSKNPVFESYLNVLQKTSTQDSLYVNTVNQYLQKAKQEQDYDHLYQAYIYKVAIEQDVLKMHQYTDSLFMLNSIHPNIDNEVRALQTKSMVYYVEKNYPKMLEFELNALKLIDKRKSPYEYYKSIYSIGQVYFYMQQYNDAKNKFKEARTYFSTFKDYNNLRGYFNSIRYEALSEYYLEDYQKSYELVQKALDEVDILEHYATFEKGYLELVLGMNLYQQKHYQESVEKLKAALIVVKKNEDYANKSIIHYYIGLNYVALRDFSESLHNFKKVDHLFQEHHYINFETLHAYNYLVEYFKNENDAEQQLYYINQQLLASVFLQDSYKSLSNTLHKKLDIEKLQTDKQLLERNLKEKNNILYVVLFTTLPAFFISLYFWIYNNRKKKDYHKLFEEAEKQAKIEQQKKNLDLERTIQDNKDEVVKNEKYGSTSINKDIEQMILKQLQDFEKKHLFLEKNLDISKLAKNLNTNRTYLSYCINTYKGRSFVDYINSLRIQYFMDSIDKNKHWKSYKIKAIAEELGFSGGRSFSEVFNKQMGFPPSYYIEQKLRKENNDIQ